MPTRLVELVVVKLKLHDGPGAVEVYGAVVRLHEALAVRRGGGAHGVQTVVAVDDLYDLVRGGAH